MWQAMNMQSNSISECQTIINSACQNENVMTIPSSDLMNHYTVNHLYYSEA